MSTPTDDAIILALTRENAALRRARDDAEERLNAATQALDLLGDISEPLLEDRDRPRGWSLAERLTLVHQRIKAFPLDLSNRYHQLPGQLYRVIIPAQPDRIEIHVIAAGNDAVARWVAAEYPHSTRPGYEPRIEQEVWGDDDRVVLITEPTDTHP